MLVKHSHILEARELRDGKVILCYIRIGNRFIKYYSGQAKAHATHRWMQAEHWAKFDEHLEDIVSDEQKFISAKSKEFKELTFWLNSSIIVRVSRCSISLDVLKRCILNDSDKWNIIQAFDFFIESKENEIPTTSQRDNEKYSFLGFPSEGHDHEYKPEFLSTQSDNACVPYTPSTKIESSGPGSSESVVIAPYAPVCQQLPDEDRYSPKPVVSRSSPQEINESPPLVPTYKPSRMKEGKTTERVTKDKTIEKGSLENQNDHEEEEKKNRLKEKKIKDLEKHRHINDKYAKKHKSSNKQRDKYKDKNSDRHEILDKRKDDENTLDFHKKIKRSHSDHQNAKENKERPISQACDLNTETEKHRQRNLVSKNEYFLLIPRNSSPSPMRNKRLPEDHANETETHMRSLNSVSPKRKHKKSKTINEDLFGSEDDEDNKDFDKKMVKHVNKISVQKTPKDSTKYKRTRCGTLDISSEKIGMDKWLGKKLITECTISALSSKHKDKRMRSCTPPDKKRQPKPKPNQDRCLSPARTVFDPATVSYPSREEIEIQMEKEKLQIERNIKVKEVLAQLAGPTPEKVDTLTIKDLSLDEVLHSFQLYKPKLDEVFRRSSKNPHQIKGYNGINHYLVMSLIDEKERMAMMNTLQDAYEPDLEGISAYATLFINAMMPEWIFCLFMDKHKLTREEAIKQVKAQDAYNLHLETQLETSATLE